LRRQLWLTALVRFRGLEVTTDRSCEEEGIWNSLIARKANIGFEASLGSACVFLGMELSTFFIARHSSIYRCIITNLPRIFRTLLKAPFYVFVKEEVIFKANFQAFCVKFGCNIRQTPICNLCKWAF
jgi:hypothetical protein